MDRFARWRERARRLRLEARALALAYRDPRVPWYAKAFAACVVAYAFSPIDLIPDPIPVLGHLDDLVLLPLGVLAARRMIPAPVLAECRVRAAELAGQHRPMSRVAAAVIVGLWIAALAGLAWMAWRVMR